MSIRDRGHGSPVELRRSISRVLQTSGMSYKVGTDMAEWRHTVSAAGGRIASHFRPEFCDQTQSRWLTIFGEEGTPFISMAWRMLEADCFVDAVESGAIYVDDPARWGTPRIATGIDPASIASDSGWLCFRGGLFSFRRGMRLSWIITSLHWSFAVDDDADVVASTAFSNIAGADLPRRLYGYAHMRKLPPTYYPHADAVADVHLVWSSREEVLAEIASRCEHLRSRDTNDLFSIVGALKGNQKAEKAS